MTNKGFTLIELVLVIAILGVLAVAALPNLFSVSLASARTNAMNATVGAVQTGITMYGANQIAAGSALSYPADLDGITGTSGGVLAAGITPLFTSVTHHGISGHWFKLADGSGTKRYAFDTDGNGTYASGSDICFQYTVATGTYLQFTCP
ncbi:MAG: prepilin-type N-terminal cleavage/methylation domain-containing protein [Deltaproteobacteria bacterium]|nr:prepilin-type N-terminal cleavage/methylation domain-containing protein [Deltaproteobacteria bacterium]